MKSVLIYEYVVTAVRVREFCGGGGGSKSVVRKRQMFY
jgi:hypothetical protein